jgi:gas vesicle protein
MISATVAALLGLGIGASVGLLLAPASGEETRSNITRAARDVRERIASREPVTGAFGA